MIVLRAFCLFVRHFSAAERWYAVNLINKLLAFSNLETMAAAVGHRAGLEMWCLLAAIEQGDGQKRCLIGS